MLSNIIFGLTALFYIGLVIFNFPKPSLVGENAMGYGLGLAFLGLGFTLCCMALTLNITYKDGFDWVSNSSGTRTLLLIFGWLVMVVTTFFCAVFKWEWHGEFPQFLRWLALSQAEIWLPLLFLVPAFFLLNAERRASVSPTVYQIPLMICFNLSTIFCAVLLFG